MDDFIDIRTYLNIGNEFLSEEVIQLPEVIFEEQKTDTISEEAMFELIEDIQALVSRWKILREGTNAKSQGIEEGYMMAAEQLEQKLLKYQTKIEFGE